MKYSMSNEVILGGNIFAQTQQVLVDYLSNICQLLNRIFKSGINFINRVSVNLLGVVLDHYSLSALRLKQRDEFEIYKKTHRRHLPYRMWSRHSALFREVDGLNDIDYREESKLVTVSPEKLSDNSFHINVKGVNKIPIWSSNLDEIGIIYSQL